MARIQSPGGEWRADSDTVSFGTPIPIPLNLPPQRQRLKKRYKCKTTEPFGMTKGE